MTSPSPEIDIGQLSISSRTDDFHEYDDAQFGSSPAQAVRTPQHHQQQQYFQTSPSVPGGQSPYAALSMGQARKASRQGLPTAWLDNSASALDTGGRSMSPPITTSDLSSGGSPPRMQAQAMPPMTPGSHPQGGLDDDVIPNAIVIKNIPFNVRRETLLEIIASLNIPTPYAFNYHLDGQGQFRGLAFANFRQPSDADAVVAALNGFDVQGRKLRVEYKKVLLAGEKERIEREKAFRRMRSMQMEKDQQRFEHEVSTGMSPPPLPFTPSRSLSTGPGFGADASPSRFAPQPPMPVPQPYGTTSPPPQSTSSKPMSFTDLDLNEPATLEIYSRILLFKDDRMRDELAFSRSLSAQERRIVHLVAQKLGVYHYSVGEGDERYAVVTRIDPDARTLHRTPSAAYLSASASQSMGGSLRMKKSMPDMKTLSAATSVPRLSSRISSGNIREGYATIASPSRRSPGNTLSLFGNTSAIPPVPTLPASISNGELPQSNVVRQPRGPGIGGFGSRRAERVIASESQAPGAGLQARSHEPLEI